MSLCLVWILTVSQREGRWPGLTLQPGCSGSAAFSCTPNWGWSCCSACQLHARRLSPTPPGTWISVRYTNIEKRVASHAAAHAGSAPLHVIKNKVGKESEWDVETITRVSNKHTREDTHKTNKNTIQGLGINSVQPTQLHILMLLCRQWQVWLQQQLSYVNSLFGVLCGTLIKPGQQTTLYHSTSLPPVAV